MARQKVEGFRALGHDIVSMGDLGLAGQRVPDQAVLRLATLQGRVVLTHNGKDFKRLHAKDDEHSGILILPDDVRHTLLAEAASRLLDETADWSGRIARVNRPPLA